MSRSAATAAVLGLVFAIGAGWVCAWHRGPPTLDCAPSAVRLGEDGVARCGAGAALPAAQALTVGQALPLNTATAEELALIPGLGRGTAEALVAARGDAGPFASWAEVDAVSGVGAARLQLLQRHTSLGPDAGLW